MNLPLWRHRIDSLTSPLTSSAPPTARYLQLATVTPVGRPAVRTVVFRGFDGDIGLRICVDGRSDKMADVRATPFAEACWYFADTREQFRLAGPVRIADEARQSVWKTLSEGGRAMFTWPTPGEALAEPAQPTPLSAVPIPTTPPETFVVLVLDVSAVDHVDLRPTPHRRTRWTRGEDGVWTETAVNP